MSSLHERLVACAKDAAAHAYCPYSHFPVGAATYWAEGLLSGGCNVENVAYGPSVCAERNAIHHAVAKGMRVLTHVVVYTPTLEPTTPCGVCLQVIREFGPQAEIVCVCDGPAEQRGVLSEFLPYSFGPEVLGR